jgi:glycosyltransferase involved in cell wall biosynthesis
MRILLLMDPGIPVPPPTYGGHERLVYMFAEAYIKMGHEVTLLAGPNSAISSTTYTFGVNNLQRSKWQKAKELIYVWKFLLWNRKKFDLVHNFGRLAYLFPILNFSLYKIMTYGRPVSQSGIKRANALPNKNVVFTACSNYCVSTGNIAGEWHTVYNAIDFSKYQLNETVGPDAPLMFLGRLDQIKGAHTAIEVALATGQQLWIGGNIPNTPDNLAYFQQVLSPKFDGEQIIYLGALNDEEKNKYLGQAKALLFPIEWDEPFGMVMVEAMACGTPVIGYNRGSVPEVIEENVTGLIVSNAKEMIDALEKISTINRPNCRKSAEKRFDVAVIAQTYIDLVKQDKN